MAIKNIYDTEISAPSFTWNGNTIATQAWVNANVGTPTLDSVTTSGSVTTNNLSVGSLNVTGGTIVSGVDTRTNVGIAIAKGDYLTSNDGSYIRNLIGLNSSSNIEIGQSGTSLISNIQLKPGSNGNIQFYASGSEDVRINSSGNVGIGTTSPAQKLDVVGTTQSTNLILTGISESAAVARWDGGDNAYEYLIGRAATTRTFSGRAAFLFHTDTTKSILFASSGWTPLLEIQGGTGDTTMAGSLYMANSTNSGRLYADDWGLKVGTSSGYIQFGPANTSWAHIYTDRPAFYFNKELYVNNAQVATRSWVTGQGYLTSVPSHQHTDADINSWHNRESVNIDTYNPDSNWSTSIATSTSYGTQPNNYTNIHNLGGDGVDFQTQIATYYGNNNRMWVRSRYDGTNAWVGWNEVWTSGSFANNSANWNTAYGWGDHAAAGYLTSYTETDTLATVVARGAFFGTTDQGYVASGGTYGTELRKIKRITLTRGSSNWDGDNHAILSEDISGADADSISINSYNGIHLRLDSNNNNANSTTNFTIHNDTTTSSNELFRITGDGNVGIGTTSPASKLHVVSSAYDVMRIERSSAGGGVGLYLENGNNNTWIIGNGGNDHFAINKSTSNFGDEFIIQSTGEVGIGTTSPLGKLDVHTDGIYYTHNNAASRNWLTAANYLSFGDFAIVQSDAQGTDPYPPANSTPRLYISTAGNVGIGTTSPSAKLHVSDVSTDILTQSTTGAARNILKSSTGEWRLGTNAGQSNNFWIYEPTLAQYVFNIDTSGNVGIGTTTPSYKLHVAGDTYTTGIINTSPNGYGILSKYGSEGLSYQPLENSSAQVRYWLRFDYTNNGSYPYLTNRTPSGDVVIKTGIAAGGGENEHFRIKGGDGTVNAYFTNANVGIGTTSPAYKLDVVGDTYTSGKYVSNSGEIISLYQSSWNAGNQNHYVLYNGWRANTGDYLMIKSSGNQSTGEAAMVLADGSGGGRTYFGTHAAQSQANDNALTPLDSTYAFIGAADTYFSSNVGIGTTSPWTKLVLDGDPRAGTANAGVALAFDGGSYAEYGYRFKANGSNYYQVLYDGAAINWKNYAGGASYTTRMSLTNAGNLGIGTTSPGYTLDVNGSMHSTNITIADAIYHEGDTNTVIGFGTDTINLSTGGGVRATINNSGTKFNNDVVVVGGATLSLGEAGEPDDLGRTVLIEGVANASNGEGSGRIFFSENNNTATNLYGLSLYYEGDPNAQLPSGFQPNTGNATWSLRRHDNNSNGIAIMSGSRTNSNVQFGGSITIGSGVTLSESTDRADLLSVTSSTNGWGGLQITNTAGEGIWSFMVDDAAAGIYDDQNGDWAVYCVENGYVQLRHNGTGKLTTSSVGVDVAGRIYLSANDSHIEFNTSASSGHPKIQMGADADFSFVNTAGSTNLHIENGGNVGIGTTAPSEKLEVSGNILASGDITAFSDARLKENVETLPNALESVKAMRGVTYNKIGEEKQSIGVIAQEVRAVLPQLVSEHNDEMLSVAYGNITAVLIEAIKEQQEQIDELKAIINGLTK